ncbi:MAG: hypothetical protein H5T85_06755 [Actinobacteria bacterium]|nr:hypothetical protein [Actinomycetota bacterium]
MLWDEKSNNNCRGKGITSKINLKDIIDRGYSYIFAYKLKQAPDRIKETAFSGGYIDIESYDEKLRYKVVDYTHSFYYGSKKINLSQKIIITYSDSRAKRMLPKDKEP